MDEKPEEETPYRIDPDELRDAPEEVLATMRVPWYSEWEDVKAFVAALEEREHTQGTQVHACSMAAVVTFQYMAQRLGLTVQQGAVADLDFLARMRNIRSPFILLMLEECLYPQYDPFQALATFIRQNRDWLRDNAVAVLAKYEKTKAQTPEEDFVEAHPDVLSHWHMLAGSEDLIDETPVNLEDEGAAEADDEAKPH